MHKKRHVRETEEDVLGCCIIVDSVMPASHKTVNPSTVYFLTEHLAELCCYLPTGTNIFMVARPYHLILTVSILSNIFDVLND